MLHDGTATTSGGRIVQNLNLVIVAVDVETEFGIGGVHFGKSNWHRPQSQSLLVLQGMLLPDLSGRLVVNELHSCVDFGIKSLWRHNVDSSGVDDGSSFRR